MSVAGAAAWVELVREQKKRQTAINSLPHSILGF